MYPTATPCEASVNPRYCHAVTEPTSATGLKWTPASVVRSKVLAPTTAVEPEAAANRAEFGRPGSGPRRAWKCAPASVERHVALSVPVTQWAHTTEGDGSSKSHGRLEIGRASCRERGG